MMKMIGILLRVGIKMQPAIFIFPSKADEVEGQSYEEDETWGCWNDCEDESWDEIEDDINEPLESILQ